MIRYVSQLLKVLKVCIVIVVICVSCFFIMAMKARQMAEDVWKQLGVDVAQANLDIKFSFINGYLDYTGAKNAKNIVLGNRVAVVKDLVEYAKNGLSLTSSKKPMPPIVNP